MSFFACQMLSYSYPVKRTNTVILRTHHHIPWMKSSLQNPRILRSLKFSPRPIITASIDGEERGGDVRLKEERTKLRWAEIGPDITEVQKQAISQLPSKMTKRCKAFMKQIICFSPQKTSLSQLLDAWVKIMKPKRADWLAVLKEMRRMEHPLLLEGRINNDIPFAWFTSRWGEIKSWRWATLGLIFGQTLRLANGDVRLWFDRSSLGNSKVLGVSLQVMDLALVQESFEANVRDYTKIIDGYGKQNRLHDAESVFQTMKNRGFTCDQVILTAMIQMYSKAGCLRLAEATFEEIKLLGLPLDKRAYGSMIMGYVRAGRPNHGECLLREMEAQKIYAGREVYKALLRAYSTIGDTKGAQRVFDAIQFAGIAPDIKLCALLINAYAVAGQSDDARSVFENLRNAGLEPSDKCVALMLAAYEKENKLKKALDLLIDLEKEGIMVGKEASEILVGWFRRLGVVGEVELVLREYSAEEVKCEIPAL
ncbi:PREDICTED: pentatricopeptide repeat-containing protein At1g01970-like isoform X1 [Nelumbo nucifera]|uniref:Pentatricopeptide repeat-containing protein At1g01970-like isoform X1 n=1 Tax=Nelumbo nucifera TaxID=4432 RepID=A0A1U8QBW0_NELNU|nr:PREDICTED: pentatricopeptide repeat-containing protein At1g01970-like isoform X1 [Nelumbo nucifera]